MIIDALSWDKIKDSMFSAMFGMDPRVASDLTGTQTMRSVEKQIHHSFNSAHVADDLLPNFTTRLHTEFSNAKSRLKTADEVDLQDFLYSSVAKSAAYAFLGPAIDLDELLRRFQLYEDHFGDHASLAALIPSVQSIAEKTAGKKVMGYWNSYFSYLEELISDDTRVAESSSCLRGIVSILDQDGFTRHDCARFIGGLSVALVRKYFPYFSLLFHRNDSQHIFFSCSHLVTPYSISQTLCCCQGRSISSAPKFF